MLTLKHIWPIVLTAILQINAQAQNDLSVVLSKADRMKKIMQNNYESSHIRPTTTDTTNSLLNGQHTILNIQKDTLKTWVFNNGILFDGIEHKYTSGKCTEKHFYRNGNYLTKIIL